MDLKSADAMRDGVTNSTCCLAIITGSCLNPDRPEDDETANAYFNREYVLLLAFFISPSRLFQFLSLSPSLSPSFNLYRERPTRLLTAILRYPISPRSDQAMPSLSLFSPSFSSIYLSRLLLARARSLSLFLAESPLLFSACFPRLVSQVLRPGAAVGAGSRGFHPAHHQNGGQAAHRRVPANGASGPPGSRRHRFHRPHPVRQEILASRGGENPRRPQRTQGTVI